MINDNIIVAIITSTPPTLMAFLAWRKGQQNANSIQEVHKNVDGKMEALLEATRGQASAEGKIQGQQEANARTDKINNN